jgi:sialidase-1
MRHSVSSTGALGWVLLVIIADAAAALPVLEQQVLFQAGVGGYGGYRIPSLAATTSGTILAFCEGRVNGYDSGDNRDVDLVLRRSQDGGRTWSAMQVVANDGVHTIGNPCPVVDRSTGTIWLPFCKDIRNVMLTKSTDDGLTWSAPIDISSSATIPNAVFTGTGPGHGIQLRSGRLLIPSWTGTETFVNDQFSSDYCFYSDDHGTTWQTGQVAGNNTGDESAVVQLANGSVYMNTRTPANQHRRAYFTSGDGGQTWSPITYDPNLPDPGCEGSILRLTDAEHFDKNRILFSNAAHPTNRANLTVRLSYDECGTWPVSKVLCPGDSAYSDLAVTNVQSILCLYENGLYDASHASSLTLARFNIEWLTDGNDTIHAPEPASCVLAVIALGLLGSLAIVRRLCG